MSGRCGSVTQFGTPCKSKVPDGQERCWIHRGPQCSVCFGSMVTHQSNRTLPCNHTFHTRCVDRWKRTCHGDPTCPMCRTPFDCPTYRCRLIIEKVPIDGSPLITDFTTNNVSSIVEGFGIDIRNLWPQHAGRMMADVLFDIEADEDLNEVLRELGLPVVRGSG
jgi:hypothetical protein